MLSDTSFSQVFCRPEFLGAMSIVVNLMQA